MSNIRAPRRLSEEWMSHGVSKMAFPPAAFIMQSADFAKRLARYRIQSGNQTLLILSPAIRM